jgi:hypothetical protein
MLNESSYDPYREARAWFFAMQVIGKELREMYDPPAELTRELRMLVEQIDRQAE